MKTIFTFLLVAFVFIANAQTFEWTPQNSTITVRLNDVFFTDNQTGWAVGNDGFIVNTTDGGENWTEQTSGVDVILRAVFFLDADTGWAVGGQVERAMLKTTDGGVNWQNMPTNDIASNQMFDIAFADADNGWLITYSNIYKTSDGGDTWALEGYASSVEAPTTNAIVVTSDTTAYIAGTMRRNNNTQAQVFYSRPDNPSDSWMPSAFDPSTTDDDFLCIDFIDSEIGFAGSREGMIYKKTGTEPGGPWERKFAAPDNSTIYSISFPSEIQGMFNTFTEISSITYALIYHTSDAGETWAATPDTIPELSLATLYAPDSTNAWIVGLGGKIYKGSRIITGIKQMGLNFDIKIYPNPATDIIKVQINTERNELIKYSLVDITGRVIKNGEWSMNSSSVKFTLNISDEVNGTYILKLSTEEGQRSYRVIKN